MSDDQRCALIASVSVVSVVYTSARRHPFEMWWWPSLTTSLLSSNEVWWRRVVQSQRVGQKTSAGSMDYGVNAWSEAKRPGHRVNSITSSPPPPHRLAAVIYRSCCVYFSTWMDCTAGLSILHESDQSAPIRSTCLSVYELQVKPWPWWQRLRMA